MGHIKISQIRINCIKNVEKNIKTCVTGHFSYDFRKTDPIPNAKVPIKRHDEYRRITWLFTSDGKHVPLNLQHCFHCFSIHVVHLVDFFLKLFNHNHRLLLESELLLKEDLPTWIHLSIFTHPRLRKTIERDVSSFPHKVSIESTKVFLDSIAAFKEYQSFPSRLSLEIEEFNYSLSFFSKTHTGHIPHFLHHFEYFMPTI